MNRNELSPDFLIDTTRKENVYLLGFLWADGWIHNKGYTHSVGMSLIKDDFILIEPLLRQFGVKSFHERQRSQNGKSFGRVSKNCLIQSKSIVDFLLENDYDKKSGCAPTKILSLIPNELRLYFWRGYLDGDGCISCRGTKREIAFWSTIEQDWSELIDVISDLGIQYQIYTYLRKNGAHKSSVLRMGRLDDLVKFGDYIYGEYDGIGLRRKHERYLELKTQQKTIHRKTSSHVGVFLSRRTGRWGANIYNPVTKKQKHLGWFSSEMLAIEAIKSTTNS